MANLFVSQGYNAGSAYAPSYGAVAPIASTPTLGSPASIVSASNPSSSSAGVVSAGNASSGSGSTSATSTKSARSTGRTTTQEASQENRQSQETGKALNIDPQALAKLRELLASVQTNPLIQSIDAGRQTAIEKALGLVSNFDPNSIIAGAQGDVADLSRKLREDILPEISGLSEASGTGVNALTALLAQDATTRTAEAQARVGEQARANAAQEQVNLMSALNQALGVGSETVGTLNDLINTAKGTIQETSTTGTENIGSTGSSVTNQQAATEEVGSTNSSTSGGGGGDALALALLQSGLSPFQNLQDLNNPYTPGRTTQDIASSRSVNDLLARLRGLL